MILQCREAMKNIKDKTIEKLKQAITAPVSSGCKYSAISSSISSCVSPTSPLISSPMASLPVSSPFFSLPLVSSPLSSPLEIHDNLYSIEINDKLLELQDKDKCLEGTSYKVIEVEADGHCVDIMRYQELSMEIKTSWSEEKLLKL